DGELPARRHDPRRLRDKPGRSLGEAHAQRQLPLRRHRESEDHEVKQIILNAKGCSSRGVRLRVLDPTAASDLLVAAAQEVGPDATMTALKLKAAHNSVVASVAAVTVKDGLKLADLPTAEWKKVSAEELDGGMAKYFNAK